MSNSNTSLKPKQTPPRPMGRGGGPLGGMMAGEKPKNFKASARSLLSYLKPHSFKLFFVLVFAVLSTVFAIVGPSLLGRATTLVVQGITEVIHSQEEGATAFVYAIDFISIGKILLFLTALYFLSAFFSWLQGFIMSGVAMNVSASLRREIDSKLYRLPFSYFDSHSYGDVLSHITNDVDTLTQNLNQSLGQIITSGTTLIGIMIMMISISLPMTVVALLVIPLSFAFVAVIVKKSQPFFKKQQYGLAEVNGFIEEHYGSHLVTKIFNGEKKAISDFDALNDELYTSAWKSQFFSGLMMPVMNFIGNIGYVAVCLLGGYLAVLGRLSIGNIQAFIQYVRQFNQPVTQIANTSNVLQSMAAASERIFDLLKAEEEPQEPKDLKPFTKDKIQGQVDFEQISFGYTKEKLIIKDFSTKVKPGQKIAIVGPTGAGKTTIVKLLMRFYNLDTGSIYIDGISFDEISREDVRSIFGMVLQDTWLYKASILENIRYGNLAASDEEVFQAAKIAQADHFIKTLPGAYDFVLNEEASNVSRGQKQLLTIARAFLANPKILILDEATSSVDTLTEVLIQKAHDNLMRGRTSFVIAHRLSTIKNSDSILVMKKGNIVESGSHQDLLKKNGFYAELYKSQFVNKDE